MSTIPKTLFLRGVFLKDLVTLGNLFDDQTKDNSPSFYYSSNSTIYIDNNDNEYYELDSVIYDKIPKTFTTMEKWPQKTNIKCTHCSLSILGVPIPIPESVDRDKESNQIFDVNIVCCSFPCSARLITYTIHNASLRHGMLGMLKIIRTIFYRSEHFKHLYDNISKKKRDYNEINNTFYGELRLAPERRELCQYGGSISVKEFRNKIWNIEFGNCFKI